MQVIRTLFATPSCCRCSSHRCFSSATASSSSSSSQTDINTNSFAGLSRQDLKAYHALVRSAQVSIALQRGYEEGACAATVEGSKELHKLLRATRTRPSLLTPLASNLGIVLRYLPVPPGAGIGNVRQGLISSLQESYDGSVRQLIEMERAEQSKAPAAAVKQFMKAKRDGLGVEDERAGTGGSSGVLTQAIQVISRMFIRGATHV
jgi:hypothetical protein